METNERNPLKWSEVVAAQALRIVTAYVRKWSGPDCVAPLSPEAVEEIAARIIFDLMTGGDIPEDMPILRHLFRVCRLWRIRNWNGDCELDAERKRRERSRDRSAMDNPGSAQSEENRNKSPYAGFSADANQPTPLAQLIAIETAERQGLRYVSDRQRKQRRRAAKGCKVTKATCHPVRLLGRPGVVAPSGRILYWPGTATEVRYRVEVVAESGPFGRPFVSHEGTIPNRQIGKSRTAAVGSDPVGSAMARMAILGRTPGRKFTPAPIPNKGIPATEGDGSRPMAGVLYEFRHGVSVVK